MTPHDDVLLAAHAIGYTKRGKPILHEVDLTLREREIVTLIGPNGAGKTSLIHILLGLKQADNGRVERRADVCMGYVPQKITMPLVMPMRVSDFLALSVTCGLFRAAKARRRHLAVLEELQIAGLYQAMIQSLSGGELQRVLLARALLKQPDLLILDEPAAGMDVIGQQTLYESIARIRETHHCGILMISHDLHLVMAATDRVVCLNTHVCCTGHPDDVSEHPEYLKLFGGALSGLALYSHHHDHEHDIHGNVIESGHCLQCEHRQMSPPAQRRQGTERGHG